MATKTKDPEVMTVVWNDYGRDERGNLWTSYRSRSIAFHGAFIKMLGSQRSSLADALAAGQLATLVNGMVLALNELIGMDDGEDTERLMEWCAGWANAYARGEYQS